MTKNEREMVLELAVAVNMLARSIELMTPEMQNIDRRAQVADRLETVDASLSRLIKMMDSEWFDNE